MKIKRCIFIIIALLFFMIGVSCSNKYLTTNTPKSESNKNNEKPKTISDKESMSYYKIGVDEEGNYILYLYDNSRNIIYSQKFAQKAPYVSKLNNDVVKISLSAGNPATYVTFFDLKNKKKSEDFFNPSSIEKDRIIYMSDKYVLIISDVFDKSKYYKEIKRNFTNTSVPSNSILEVKFIENNKLYLKYLEGDSMTEKTEIINLTI